jgi:hypothetical protein
LGTLRTLYTNADILSRFGPVWNPVRTSMYGQVDKFIKDRVYKLPLRLWGAWENLDALFPSYALAPQAGASIFGTSDTPWSILARNGDKITYQNAQITKLANLYLGVDADMFAADVELTAIIKNNANPEDSNAYYQVQTGQSYSDNAFAKTNYKRRRFTGSWGSVAGFSDDGSHGPIVPQKGFQISWELDAKPLTADGLGTVDFTIGENVLQGTCKCIPILPTMAQIEAQAAAQGVALGSLLGNLVADLTLTAAGSGAPVIVLKNAALTEHSYAFGIEPLRIGELTWQTTRGFSAGTPAAVATVS